VASDIISNEHGEQKIMTSEILKKLVSIHNGTSEEFENFLKENYFDLYYQAQRHAASLI
jgi:hypothetical protein